MSCLILMGSQVCNLAERFRLKQSSSSFRFSVSNQGYERIGQDGIVHSRRLGTHFDTNKSDERDVGATPRIVEGDHAGAHF